MNLKKLSLFTDNEELESRNHNSLRKTLNRNASVNDWSWYGYRSLFSSNTHFSQQWLNENWSKRCGIDRARWDLLGAIITRVGASHLTNWHKKYSNRILKYLTLFLKRLNQRCTVRVETRPCPTVPHIFLADSVALGPKQSSWSKSIPICLWERFILIQHQHQYQWFLYHSDDTHVLYIPLVYKLLELS